MAGAHRQLAMLCRHVAWANDRLYTALADVESAMLAAPTPIFAGSIARTLNHVRLIDVVWQSHLLGVPHGFTTRNPEHAPPFTELRTAQAEIDTWFIDYAASLDIRRRDEVVRFTFIGGGTGAMRRRDILAHVVNHTTYHRGHITAMLYQAGIQPPVTDLPVFTRDAGPDS